jgi:formate C-acetyltransferase
MAEAVTRSQRIRERLFEHAISGLEYRPETKADIERARYWTESFKETEGEPLVTRRAKALAHYLEKKTIFITEDELITGSVGRTPYHIIFYPEIESGQLLKTEFLTPGMLTPEEWDELEKILSYWKGKTLEEQCLAIFPDEVKNHVCPSWDWRQVNSHAYQHGRAAPMPDLEMLLSTGLDGIMKKIETRLAELDLLGISSNIELQQTISKRNVLNAMLIAAKGVITYVSRYSKLAREMAEEELSPIRKAELEQIAENCARVPREPAQTFWQALQAIWFVHLEDHVFEGPAGGLGQRFDQLLYPYYRRDIETGRLTREKAQELLENLWLKYEREINFLQPKERREEAEGGTMFQNVTIGGVDEYGNDATNELSYLILDTTKSVRTTQPTLSIRYHAGMPDDLLAKAWEVIKTGMGMPAFFNDKPMISHMLSRGVSLKDARNQSLMGCMGPGIPGKNTHAKEVGGQEISAAKCLEIALNNGIDMLDGKKIGPNTGDPTSFSRYEDVVAAFRVQVEYALKISAFTNQVYRLKQAELLQRPFSSCLCKSAIERAEDVTSYEDYDWPFMNVTGMIDAVDSLTAIKKLIFDDRKVTWNELLSALKADFKGYETVWQLCHGAPKFGSDDDYVDNIAKETFALINSEVEEIKDIRGRSLSPIYQSVAVFVKAGRVTAALPCGRKAREPLADGGASPETGFGQNPIEVLKSVSKIDHERPQRILLNQRLSLATTARQFVNLTRTWGELGISHTQFNVFDVNLMRDAQVHPEKYPDLIVRVAGYSAHFIFLNRVCQDAIIRRAEQSLAA